MTHQILETIGLLTIVIIALCLIAKVSGLATFGLDVKIKKELDK